MAEGKDAGGFRYNSSTGGNGLTTSGKRRLIWGGGPAPRVRDKARPRDPGGGGSSINRFPSSNNNESRTDDHFKRRPRVQTIRRTEDGRPAKRIVSPFTSPMPVPPSDRPQLGPWQVAVVRVEEIPVEDATKVKTPYTTADRRRPIDLPEVEGNDSPVLLAAPPPPRAGVRRCEGPAGRSSHAEKTREPFPVYGS